MSVRRGLHSLAVLLLAGLALAPRARADASLHTLWEVHGKHNTVYLLGSIHVLRPGDYPLAQPVLDAYARSGALVMEVDLDDLAKPETAADLLAESRLPEGKSLPTVLGAQRYAHASTLARDAGAELATFDGFAPWFAAEAVSQLQLAKLGFTPESGVEMYFMGKAHQDGKGVTGLETVHDQLSMFGQLSLDAQADYLLASLEEAHELPSEVDALVTAWKHGDTRWFENELQQEFGSDPHLYESLITGRNRKWVPKIEALLNDDLNVLVIVGTGHLVGRGSVIELLKKDGIGATQK